jgi:hypothetical protein
MIAIQAISGIGAIYMVLKKRYLPTAILAGIMLASG